MSLVNINKSSLFCVLVAICVSICIAFCVPHVSKLPTHLCGTVCVTALQSPASLCEPHGLSECALHVPAAGARDKAPTLDPRLLLCTGLVTLRESCRKDFMNSWALLNSIPAEYMCPWLVPTQNSPSLGDSTDKPLR